MKTLIYLLMVATVLGGEVSAQSPREDSPENLQKYVPVLPSVKASFWQIDPKLGYVRSKVSVGACTSFPITGGNLPSS